MTQKLKKEDRELVLRKVLTEAFEKRFYAVRDAMRAEIAAHIAKTHPRFVELAADETARSYLTSDCVSVVRLPDGRRATSPVYGTAVEEPDVRSYYTRSPEWAYLDVSNKVRLAKPSTYTACVSAPTTIASYDKCWTDYTAAQAKLSALLNSYSSREKLAEDFPEFAKHVPLAQAKAKLPAVIVTDVLAELAVLGVPATE